MAHVAKLDGLDINDGVKYTLGEGLLFGQPPLRSDIQSYLQDHGGSLVAGSDYYGVVKHTIPVLCEGTTVADLYANIRALQAKVLLRDVVFEFRYTGSTNTNYADVLYAYADETFSRKDWAECVTELLVPVTLYLVCKPFWRPSLVTSALTASANSPIELIIGETRTEQDGAAVTYSGSSSVSSNAGHSGGTAKVLAATSAYAEFAFIGTSVKWIAYKYSDCGIAQVLIDGVPITNGDTALPGDAGANQSGIDLYKAAPIAYQQVAYSCSSLTEGAHTIRVIRTATKNAASSDYGVTIDAFDSAHIEGTCPTPLRVWLDPQDPATDQYQRYYLGACPKDSGISLIHSAVGPWVGGADVTDATAHGGAYRRVSISNAGTIDIDGVFGYERVAESSVPLDSRKFDGRFRLMARMRTADATPASVELIYIPFLGYTNLSHSSVGTIALKPFSSNNWTLVDFGTISLPPGPVTESYVPTIANDYLDFFAKGSSATAYNFDTDYFVLMPLDSAFYLRTIVSATDGESYLINGTGDDVTVSRVMTLYQEAACWPGGSDAAACGGPLMVYPGVTNRLVILSFPDVATNAVHSIQARYAYYPHNLSPVR